ncbi:MAG: copper ABC transporter permease [Lachnospiraceae bacterium]|nr:copper ABC transporter permease [Lachnospiraceae bacterium]
MIAIYKREVKAFFNSFIGWLFLAATLLMLGIYFTVYNIIYGYPSIVFALQSVVFLFMIAIPILTMRILAEDRKQKTDQLILTAPVTIGKIVLGKYLALLSVYIIPVVIIGSAPIILSFFGNFQIGVSYTALLGFCLYGAFALSLGLFVSSLTESIIISAVITFAALFLGYLMSGLCSIISQTGNWLTKILSAFDIIGRFDDMSNGTLYVPSVVYYISFTLFMLFCTTQSIQKRRYSASSKGFKIGAYSSGMIVIAAVLTVGVNIVVAQLPESVISIDVTSNKLYTLTDATKEFVTGLEDDVTIYVLAGEEYKDDNLDKTIGKIEGLSNHIKVSYIDPSVNPRFYSQYSSTEPTYNSLIVAGPERSRLVDYNDIYEYEMDYSSYQSQITGYDGEGQLTSALAYVTTDDMPKIYIIIGHNELEFEGLYTQAIQKENIDYEELSLLTVEAIPDDAQAIILNAPTTDYSTDDVDKVINYLDKGGNAVIVPTWTEEKLTNYEKILDYYKVSIVDGMIIEGDSGMYYANPFYIFPQINYDEITSGVTNAAVFAPFARGLSYDEENETIYYTSLLESSSASYSKVNLATSSDYGKEDGDIDGPFTIALRAEKELDDGGLSSAVIVATENLFTKSADDMVPGNNVKLFSSVLSALVEHESSVSIPVKSYDSSNLVFPTKVYALVGIFTIVIIPLSCLVIGFVIWFKRRKK